MTKSMREAQMKEKLERYPKVACSSSPLLCSLVTVNSRGRISVGTNRAMAGGCSGLPLW